MVAEKTLLGVFVAALSVIIITHISFQFIVYGTGTGTYKNGLSGFSIGKVNLGDEISRLGSKAYFISWIIIGIEAFLIVGASAWIYDLRRRYRRNEADIFALKERFEKDKKRTALDVVYNILKEKKKMKLSVISSLFGVPEKTAKSWGYTLESGNLATLHSPKIGEPQIILKE